MGADKAEKRNKRGGAADGGRFPSRAALTFYFLRGSAHYFVLAAIFAAFVSLFDLVSPKVISFAVDYVIGSEPVPETGWAARLSEMAGGIGFFRENAWVLALAVALLGVLAGLFRYIFRSTNARGAETFVERTRNELFSHILSLPYRWLGENPTGDLIQRCTSDVQTIKRFVAEQMTQLVRTTVLILMALGFMGSIDLRVTAASAVFIPVIIGYSLVFHRKIGGAFRKADEEEGILSTIAQENLTGVRVVRAFGREISERKRFETQNEKYTGFWVHLMKLLSVFWSVGDIMTGLQILAVVVLGAYFCVGGTLTAGNYIALISYNIMLTWPVRAVGRVISEMSKAGIAVERLRYIMNAVPEKDRPDAGDWPKDGTIAFEHVTFAYGKDSAPVLRDVSFTVPGGQTVGILGGTGSGKSTLMYLLLRLYDLEEGCGRITVGGVDIRQIRASELRRHIGIVLQEPYLFSRTLSENIAIADPSADMARISGAAKIAAIDSAIRGFAKGYDTFVGERGVTLSGGQKQRTAIAQMLVRDHAAEIYDDSLSAVDAETDRKIRMALAASKTGASRILIAHRITTLINADRIIVLDKGRIREEGTHEELLLAGGLYKKIYELQTAGAALDGEEVR